MFQVLVGVDEQGAVTLQRALWEQVVQSVEAEQLVNAFIDARLLVANRGEGTRPVVEVAHEALLTSWPLLANWIKDMLEDLKLLRRLKLDAAEWDKKGRAEEYLWPNGRRFQADYMRKRLRPKLSEIEELFLKMEPKHYLQSVLSEEELASAIKTNADIIATIQSSQKLLGGFRNFNFIMDREQAAQAYQSATVSLISDI